MNEMIYTLSGVAKDIETIIRLRPWMEDEVKYKYCEFSNTKLLTDYDAKNETFSFKIQFYK